MPEKYRNKYRIKSARAPWWDYARDAAYFITICTKNRERFFGEIINAEMQLSPVGEIVETEWLKTLELRPDMNLKNKFGPQSKNLASIIRGFKSSVTMQATPEFAWQSRFHDHIIRDEAEYRRIAQYIINNPANWQGDRFYHLSSS